MSLLPLCSCSQVRTGRDDSALMTCLFQYLTDNEQIIANYFQEADVNKSGTLDHTEICALVSQIPGLTADEQRFISSYLYQVGGLQLFLPSHATVNAANHSRCLSTCEGRTVAMLGMYSFLTAMRPVVQTQLRARN